MPHVTRHTPHLTPHTSHALQICPFPFQGVREAIDRYPNAQVSWVQVRFCICTFVSDVFSRLSVFHLRHAPCLCILVLRSLIDHVTSIRLTAGGAKEPRRLVLYRTKVIFPLTSHFHFVFAFANARSMLHVLDLH